MHCIALIQKKEKEIEGNRRKKKEKEGEGRKESKHKMEKFEGRSDRSLLMTWTLDFKFHDNMYDNDSGIKDTRSIKTDIKLL